MADPLFPSLECPDDRVALRYGADAALTARSLATATARLQRELSRRGIAPGERLAVWTHPAAETLALLTAAFASGAVLVPLNPALGRSELAHVLSDAAPRAVFCAPGAHVDALLTQRPETEALSLLGGAPERPESLRCVDDAPLLVLYTSGTTGAPKGAVLTARNVASNLDALARAWELTADSALVHALPLFHVHGLALGLLGALRAGASLRWLGRFDPHALAAILPDAVLYAVPTMYHRLAEAGERDPVVARALGAARLLVSGSAPLSVREHARLEALAGQRVLERYGLTETLINCATRAAGERRAGFVGPAVDGVSVQLVDERRAPLADGDEDAVGEVAVRGPNVFAGYLGRPEATAATRDALGWFYTGDVAMRSKDGYFRIVGRQSTDLLKTGGYKVGAGEVEACLLAHPTVREAAVVGVPDDDLGERIVAFVVPAEGAVADPATLSDWVRGELAAHKRPRAVHLCAELPRNAMGKVLKAQLRVLATERR